MNKTRIRCIVLLLGLVSSFAMIPAQAEDADAEMTAFIQSMTPGAEHAYLETLAGSWRATFWSWSDPEAEPAVGTGTLERKMVMGGRVLEETIDAQILGLPYKATGNIGYDNGTGTYWATSFDSLSTGLTVLRGQVEPSTGKATFIGETPEPSSGASVRMRLEIFFEQGGAQVTESYFTLPGKGEVLVVKTLYERQ